MSTVLQASAVALGLGVLHAVAPGPARAQRCTAAAPLRLAVLVDHSSSMSRHEPRFKAELGGWLHQVVDLLRPEDQVVISGLQPAVGPLFVPLAEFDVAEPRSEPDERNRRKVQLAAEALLTENPSTDLADGLEKLRKFLSDSGSVCPPVVLLLTDGSLAPLGRGVTREMASRDFAEAVGALTRDSIRFLVLRAGSGRGPAFDPEYRWQQSARAWEDPRLSADSLLARVTEDREPPPHWLEHERLAAALFESRRFWDSRGMQWFPGKVADIDFPGISYLLYRGGAPVGDPARDSLLACNHQDDVHDGVDHTVSRIAAARDSCYHHLKGPVDHLLPALERGGLTGFVWAQLDPKLFLDAIPDPLRSLHQVVVSVGELHGCTLNEVNYLRFERPFPARWKARERVRVWVSDPDRRWRDSLELTLYRVGSTPCFAPADLPALPAESNGAQRLLLRMQLLGAASRASTVRLVDARLVNLPWHRLRRLRRAPYLPLFYEEWLVEGRIQLPASSDDSVQLTLGARPPTLLDAADDQRECGKEVAPGYTCFEFQKVVDSEPPTYGRIALHQNPGVNGRSEPEVYFRTAGFLASHETLTPPWIVVAVLVVGLLVAFTWPLQLEALPAETGHRPPHARLRVNFSAGKERLREFRTTHSAIGVGLAIGILGVIVVEEIFWSRIDRDPLTVVEVRDSFLKWIVCLLLTALCQWACRKIGRRISGGLNLQSLASHLRVYPMEQFGLLLPRSRRAR